ncbi:MAG TPA: peptidoglycan-associated lipoprotein Pal [Thermodesulfobacteriota bacterium]
MPPTRATSIVLVAVVVLAAGCGGRRSDTIQAADLPRATDGQSSPAGPGAAAPGGAGAPEDAVAGRTLEGAPTTTAPGGAAPGEQLALGPTVDSPAGPVQEVEALRDVYFEFDSASLTDGAREALNFNANWMQRFPGTRVLIEGHTDQRGSTAYNLALGERRAVAARDYLVSLGIARERIQTISYGKERPADPGQNEAAWAKNRRAHFVVVTQSSGAAR